MKNHSYEIDLNLLKKYYIKKQYMIDIQIFFEWKYIITLQCVPIE